MDIAVLGIAAAPWLMLPPPPPPLEQADENAELSATSAKAIEVWRLSMKPPVQSKFAQ
jgi:hypothetical protein